MADYMADRAAALAEAETTQRRARAAADPTRWRVGGSEGARGLTIYQGARIKLASLDGPQVAAYVVSVLNQAEQAGRDMAAGDRLDAERRGESTECDHSGRRYWDHELSGERCARCNGAV